MPVASITDTTMKFRIALVLLMLAMSGCYYDKEELLYGTNPPCATNDITYSATVNNIINANGCLNCHAGTNPSANINLQGYNNLKSAAAGGRLFGAINHSAGFAPMPQGGNKMSACDISKIAAWIKSGMPQ